jgi:hypothetical protein
LPFGRSAFGGSASMAALSAATSRDRKLSDELGATVRRMA